LSLKKVEDYSTYLTVQANFAASTQNQAFNTLVFLYKRVLECPLESVEAVRTHKEPRIPVVLTCYARQLLFGDTKALCAAVFNPIINNDKFV